MTKDDPEHDPVQEAQALASQAISPTKTETLDELRIRVHAFRRTVRKRRSIFEQMSALANLHLVKVENLTPSDEGVNPTSTKESVNPTSTEAPLNPTSTDMLAAFRRHGPVRSEHPRRPPWSVADSTRQLSIRFDVRTVERIDDVRARSIPIAGVPEPTRAEIIRIALTLGLEILERQQREGG